MTLLHDLVAPERPETWTAPIVVEAESPLPTPYGEFRFLVFKHRDEPGKEHVALIRGEVAGDDVLVRVHSECLTSEVFGSLKCDCKGQLDRAIERIAEEGRGLVVYLRQEGRDIGLANKVRAYALQASGLDTVDANRALRLPDDARRYDAAAALFDVLDIRSVRLLTNNPDKVTGLAELGVAVRAAVPHIVPSHPLSAGYLATKRARMRHSLPIVT